MDVRDFEENISLVNDLLVDSRREKPFSFFAIIRFPPETAMVLPQPDAAQKVWLIFLRYAGLHPE